MLSIEVRTANAAPETFAFEDTNRVSFGVSPEADVVLDGEGISPFHGEFVCEGGAWRIQVNEPGVRVRRRPGAAIEPLGLRSALAGGEEIILGGVSLLVDAKAAAPTVADPGPAAGMAPRLAEKAMASADEVESAYEQDSRELALLFGLSKDLNRLDRFEDVLKRIGEVVFQAFEDATHFSICTPDDAGLYVPRFVSTRVGEPKAPQLAVSQSIIARAVRKGAGILFSVIEGQDELTRSVLLHSIGSAMAIPLGGEEGGLGVMLVDNRSSGRCFEPRDLDFAIVLASSANAALERAQHKADIERMFEGFVSASVTAIEARDPTTSGHSRRVARLSASLAEAANRAWQPPFQDACFAEAELVELVYAALLHDFGKVAVPECVLLKADRLHPEEFTRVAARLELAAALEHARALEAALDGSLSRDVAERQSRSANRRMAEALKLVGAVNTQAAPPDAAQIAALEALAAAAFARAGISEPLLTEHELASLTTRRGTLNPEERGEIQSHVVHSHRVLSEIPWPRHLGQVPELVVTHHEKLDGSGYPHQIRGDAIPMRARILTVCDIFDAVTAADRPYRRALPTDGGLDLLQAEARSGQLDGDVVKLFIESRAWDRAPEHGRIAELVAD